jgi:hypothetical protein
VKHLNLPLVVVVRVLVVAMEDLILTNKVLLAITDTVMVVVVVIATAMVLPVVSEAEEICFKNFKQMVPQIV